MTIFLAVLKVIGWILLILLLLLLFIIFALLFIPVRYHAQADIQNGARGKGTVSWFLHLLQVGFFFDHADLEVYAKILFWRKMLYSSREEGADPETGLEAETEEDSFSWEPLEESIEEDRWRDELEKRNPELKSSGHSGSEPEFTEFPEGDEESGEQPHKEQQPDSKQPDSKRKRVYFQDRIFGVFRRIRGCFSRIREAWKDAKITAKKLKRMIEDERNQKAVSHLKKEFLFLLKVICPRKMKLRLQYSAGSPDITGQILGICAIFPVMYRNRWKISPDFEAEKAYMSGETEVKGRIFLFHIVALIFRVILDQNCRRLYRMKNRYFG